mgnify:FL=1
MGKSQSSSPKLTKAFIGYGHYQLTATYSDYVKTAITGNMELIDRLNSDVEKEREEATAKAIAFVQEQSL